MLFTWGNGNLGKLGDGIATAHSVSTPYWVYNLSSVQVIDGSAGFHHSIVCTCSTYWHFVLTVTAAGSVYTFGWGLGGLLGDGLTADHNSPLPFEVPGLTGCVSVSAGELHSMVLLGKSSRKKFC